MNSKLRPSSAIDSQNSKTISLHAWEPSAMSTSPMKKRLSPKVCCCPGGCLISSWNIVAESPTEEKKVHSRESLYTIGLKKVRKWAKKLWILVCMHHFFLTLRNTNLGCKSRTLFSSRMYMLPKRLRASAGQHFLREPACP